MVWLLKFLVFGHVHKWDDVRAVKLEDRAFNGRVLSQGSRYVTKCAKCGAYRKWDCI